ncbi:hypothetical protein HMPREF1508_1396 [Shuttleworthella sp. MSX8B]|nr:hypothetical protein HMPREF1508_1396 [Shuttleworthia sp. MSX8B]
MGRFSGRRGGLGWIRTGNLILTNRTRRRQIIPGSRGQKIGEMVRGTVSSRA